MKTTLAPAAALPERTNARSTQLSTCIGALEEANSRLESWRSPTAINERTRVVENADARTTYTPRTRCRATAVAMAGILCDHHRMAHSEPPYHRAGHGGGYTSTVCATAGGCQRPLRSGVHPERLGTNPCHRAESRTAVEATRLRMDMHHIGGLVIIE